MRLFVLLPLLLLFASLVAAAQWSKEDVEIFTLQKQLERAEGKEANFYSFMKLGRRASAADIRKAYRQRSMEMHPDKHRGDPQAAKRFERLGLVNKILRDARRDRYDHFLSKGFPKWRKNESGAADFYYQRWRPSLALVLAILVLFTSGVQHVVQRLTYARDLERLTTLTENAQLVAWGPTFRNSTGGGRPERKVRVEVRAPPLPPKNADKEEEERTLRRLLASRTEEGPRIEVRVSEQGLYVSDGEGGWESLGKETLTLPSVHTTWPLALLRRLTGAQAPAPAREQPAAAVEKVKKAQ